MPLSKRLIATIRESGGIRLRTDTVESARGGGGTAASRVLAEDGRAFFLKTAGVAAREMFAAEQAGLAELAAAHAVRVPAVFASGVAGDTAFVLLEYLELSGSRDHAAGALGAALARLHRHRADRFGWSRDNTIGSTPQPNPWTDDWVAFFREQRLGYQLGLAERAGHGRELSSRGERLMTALPGIFAGHRPAPSLLHGDLWGGNWGALPDGTPVIFDPAINYGDREADLAMTELFGGFGAKFYAAYEAAWPLDPGFSVRRHLYNLYHVLNHLNLFGPTYLRQAVDLIDYLLAEAA